MNQRVKTIWGLALAALVFAVPVWTGEVAEAQAGGPTIGNSSIKAGAAFAASQEEEEEEENGAGLCAQYEGPSGWFHDFDMWIWGQQPYHLCFVGAPNSKHYFGTQPGTCAQNHYPCAF